MKITKCRICGGTHFDSIVNLGYQKMTGIFPKEGQDIEGGELNLVKCTEKNGCGLIQLDESFESHLMYGDNYGYRSGLNGSMVEHLSKLVEYICNTVELDKSDLVVDIGSNDGTLLGIYEMKSDKELTRIGIDPTGEKFRKYYKDGIKLIADFFSAEKIKEVCKKKAKVITSIAMFYDLDDPIGFAKDIYNLLDDNGIWITEQSYCPSMIEACAYDTICHEHLEYYSLKQLQWIAEQANLKIIDVELNDTNGGSFRLTICKKDACYATKPTVAELVKFEEANDVNSIEYTREFVRKIKDSSSELLAFLNEKKEDGELVLGYGASTKGNVILQYCGITKELLPAIMEVNPDKYGCVTPGTSIPIISEEAGRKLNPNYILVLPWHFKENIIAKEQQYIKESGCKFVFAFPKFEIIER